MNTTNETKSIKMTCFIILHSFCLLLLGSGWFRKFYFPIKPTCVCVARINWPNSVSGRDHILSTHKVKVYHHLHWFQKYSRNLSIIVFKMSSLWRQPATGNFWKEKKSRKKTDKNAIRGTETGKVRDRERECARFDLISLGLLLVTQWAWTTATNCWCIVSYTEFWIETKRQQNTETKRSTVLHILLQTRMAFIIFHFPL